MALGADFVTLSAHKLGGPVGIGALVLRPGLDCPAFVTGGKQERDRRAGTENVPAIIGFAAALERAASGQEERARHTRILRDTMAQRLSAALGNLVQITTPLDRSAPHILHMVFREAAGLDPEMLLLRLDLEGIQASAGSACGSGAMEPSHVVRAMGWSGKRPATLRLSLAPTTSKAEIEVACDTVIAVVNRQSRSDR
jgi:cysteine desulfurase